MRAPAIGPWGAYAIVFFTLALCSSANGMYQYAFVPRYQAEVIACDTYKGKYECEAIWVVDGETVRGDVDYPAGLVKGDTYRGYLNGDDLRPENAPLTWQVWVTGVVLVLYALMMLWTLVDILRARFRRGPSPAGAREYTRRAELAWLLLGTGIPMVVFGLLLAIFEESRQGTLVIGGVGLGLLALYIPVKVFLDD